LKGGTQISKSLKLFPKRFELDCRAAAATKREKWLGSLSLHLAPGHNER